jgi:pseudouridine kinase
MIAVMDSTKEQLLALLAEDPFIGQQALAERLGLSRSAVAGHLAGLTREGRILGRAYVLAQAAAIVCIGGANIDRKLRLGAALQMGSSNLATQSETPGGVARNVAENLARLGLSTQLISALGDDAAGRDLLAQAAGCGLSTQGCVLAADEPTGSYTAVLDAAGEMLAGFAAMSVAARLTPEFLSRSAAQRAAARLIVADLNLPAESVALLLQEAHANIGKPNAAPLLIVAVSVPKMAHLPADLRGLHSLVLNLGELQALTGLAHTPLANDVDGSGAAALQKALDAVHARGAQHVLLTRGADGLVCSSAGRAALYLAAAPRATAGVVDVTGAGDAFAAGVAAGLFHDPTRLQAACQIGLRLAALTLQTTTTVHPQISPRLLTEMLAE